MNYKLDLGAWNSVFAVPCSLVDKQLKLAGKEQLQVILWVLRHAGESFSPEDIAGALQMDTDSALDALDYWRDRGVLAFNGGEISPVPQKTEETAGSRQAGADKKPSNGAAPKRRFAKPDSDYLARRSAESKNIKNLLQEAEATLGILSPAMTSTLIASCDDYGLPAEVVALLVHYAKEVGKTSTAYIDSVARDWSNSEIFTLEAAEEKLKELSERKQAWSRVSGTIGLSRRSPSKKEGDFAVCWVYEWKFSNEMISAAYDRCVDATGKFSAAYMNRVLERWHAEGIRSTDELKREEEQKKADSKKGGASYDINELEEMSFFDLPEDL